MMNTSPRRYSYVHNRFGAIQSLASKDKSYHIVPTIYLSQADRTSHSYIHGVLLGHMKN